MNDIQAYVKNSLARGRSDEDIANDLRSAGWRDEAIDQAFIAAAQTPGQVSNETDLPKNAQLNFLYLLSFIALYISVFSFIGTAFGSIDSVFGVELGQAGVESLRWNIAFLVVVFPVFLVTNHYIRKISSQSAGSLHMSSTRRAFTYITLFITALALIISAVRLVYMLTGAELVMASVLKILCIVLVAGGLFGYYFNDVRQAVKDR